MNQPSSGAEDPGDRAPENPKARRRFLSDDLFAGEREILITHRGEDYRLRVTRNGKLILTK